MKTRSEEWHEVHRTIMGGSDAAAACGLSKWQTRLEVFLEKRGVVPPDEAGEQAYWGHRHEATVLSEYAMRHEVTVLGRVKRMQDGEMIEVPALFLPDLSVELVPDGDPHLAWLETLRHAEHEFMGANLDGVVFNGGSEPATILDAKTAGAYMRGEWGETGTDHIPDDALCQQLHYAEVVRSILGRPIPFVLPTLIGGNEYREFPVEWDESAVAGIIEQEIELWERIKRNDPPEVTAGDTDALKKLYPWASPETTLMAESGGALEELAKALKRARMASDEAGEVTKLAENEIKVLMKDHDRIEGVNWKIPWSNVQPKPKTDWQAVARHMQNLGQVTDALFGETVDLNTETPKPYRRFDYKRGIAKLEV